MKHKHDFQKENLEISRERLNQEVFFSESDDEEEDNNLFNFISSSQNQSISSQKANSQTDINNNEPPSEKPPEVEIPSQISKKLSSDNCDSTHNANQNERTSSLGELNSELTNLASLCYHPNDINTLKGIIESGISRIEILTGHEKDSAAPSGFAALPTSSYDRCKDVTTEVRSVPTEVKFSLEKEKESMCCDLLMRNSDPSNRISYDDIADEFVTAYFDKWIERGKNVEFSDGSIVATSEVWGLAFELDNILKNNIDSGPFAFNATGICVKSADDLEGEYRRWAQHLINTFDGKALDMIVKKLELSGDIDQDLVANRLKGNLRDSLAGIFADFNLTDESIEEWIESLGIDIDDSLTVIGLGATIVSLVVPALGLSTMLTNFLVNSANIAGHSSTAISILRTIASDFGATEEEILHLAQTNPLELLLRYHQQSFEEGNISPYANFALTEIANDFLSNELEDLFRQLETGVLGTSQFIDKMLSVVDRTQADTETLFNALWIRRFSDDLEDGTVVRDSMLEVFSGVPLDSTTDPEVIRQEERDELEVENPGFFSDITLFGRSIPRTCIPRNGNDPFRIFQNDLETFINGLLHFYGLGTFDEPFQLICPSIPFEGPLGNQATLESLPIHKTFQPIALESVDCIGEQCEAFPRLRYRVRVIQPGRSLNNYEYSPQMLRRSARLLEGVPVQAYGFGQYQPMFSHLPAELEPMQPSGFALNRVGLLKEAAYENHPDFGEGLFATLVVDKAAEGWAKAILDEATTPGGNGTGVSIFADIDGDYGYDDLNDNMYVKVNNIQRFRSVDLASQPAAGGAIVAAIEDAGSKQRAHLNALKAAIKSLTIEEIITARQGYAH